LPLRGVNATVARVPRLVLAKLKKRYVDDGRSLPAAIEALLRADERSGAQAILRAIDQKRHARRAEGQRLRGILKYERELWGAGVVLVAGVDEAGMSPLAGPVAAGAVIFPPGARIPGVDDSKKLDAKQRDELSPIIKETALAWSVALVPPEEIDAINIYWAGLLAMRRAIEGLGVAPEHLLIDGRKLREFSIPQERIVKGDEKSLSIAAASILAKTTRDAIMVELDARYPGYGFARHKGYPVKEHFSALARLGACAIHRRSFAPVREVMGLPPLPPWPAPGTRISAGGDSA
jgi:ribonuclease HII